MPSLLSGRVKLISPGTNYTVINNYISLGQAQAGLGASPTTNTGYTLVIGPNGQATYTNTLGQIAFSTGTITSQAPTGDLTLNPSGTGTITLNGPVNIPQGIQGSGFKTEAKRATTGNILVNQSTSTVIYDGYHVDYLDRLLVRAQDDARDNGIYYVYTSTFATNVVTTQVNYTQNSYTATTYNVGDANSLVAGSTLTSLFVGFNTTIVQILDSSTFLMSNPGLGTITGAVSTASSKGLTNSVTLSRSTDAVTTNGLKHVVVPIVGGTYEGRLFFTSFLATQVLGVDPLYWFEIVDSTSYQTVYNKYLENVTVGQYYPNAGKFTLFTATNTATFANATDSTATTNGAVTVTGGVGIQKSLFVGGATNIQGSLNVNSQANINPADATVSIQPTGIGTVTINPATKGTINNIDIGNTIPKNGTFVNLTANNQLLVTSTSQSTSTTTGAVQIAGGVGIGGNLVLGGQLIFSGLADEFVVNNFRAKGQVQFTTSTNSTSTTTGGLVVSGGVGIAQDLVLGGRLIFQGSGTNLSLSTLSVTSSSQSTSTTTGAMTVVGGVGIGGNLTLGGQLIFSGAAGNLKVSTLAVTSSTNSTSTTTGAFTVTGGVGIGQDLVLGGNLIFTNAVGSINAAQVHILGTNTSVSTQTGALVVDGGVGVAKDVVVGGNLDLGGQLTFNKSFTATFVALHITSTASNVASFVDNAIFVEGGQSVKKDLSVYGNTVLYGNLTVAGTQTVVDSQNTYIIDPVIDIGTGVDNTPLLVNDGYDRGMLLHYSTGVGAQFDNHAFIGRDATTGFLTYKVNIYPGGYEYFPPAFANTGSFGTAQFGGLRLSGGAVALSTNTGDLQVLGGIGVTGGSYFGGTLTLGSALANTTQTINHALVVSSGGIGVAGASFFAGQVKFSNAQASTDPSSGAVVLSGGLGVGGSIFTAGPMRIRNSTASVSTGTGALVVSGGAGFDGDIYAHNIYTDAGLTQLANFNGGRISDPLFIDNTTTAISTTTGALRVGGGVGIGGALWVAGTANVSNLFVNGAAVLTTSSPTGFNGGTIIYPLQIGYSTSTLNTTGLTVNSGVNSVSTDSGAIVTIGGVGIGQDLHVGGTIYREGDITTANWGQTGIAVNLASAVYTDNQASGSFTNTNNVYVGQPIINSRYGSAYAQANTVFIEDAPKVKTTATTSIADSYAVWVNNGKVHIGSTASSATNYLNNALSVAGGIGIAGAIQASGPLSAPQIFDSGNRVVTFVDIIDGPGISSTPDKSGGTTATITINNTGVLTANAGTGINVDRSTGDVIISNVGVTKIETGSGISASTSTGTVSLVNTGVLSLTAGTDTAVSSTTGNITVYSTATLASVTSRGATTTSTIRLTNTQTGLVVGGDAVFSGTVAVTGTLNIGGASISGGNATFTSLQAGDTLITGQLTVSGTSTFINSQQLTVVDPVIDVGTNINNAPLLVNDGFDRGVLMHYSTTLSNNIAYDAHAFLGRDNASGKLTYRTNIWPGGVTDVPNPFSSTGTLGTAVFARLELQGGIASTSPTTGDLQVVGGIGVGGASYIAGQARFGSQLNANATATGAVIVDGGQSITKDLYIGGNVIVRGFVLTTATAYNGGEVFNPVIITNGTSATNTLTGALIVHDGGAGIGGDVYVGGALNAKSVLVDGKAITTDIHLVTGPGLVGAVTTSSGGVTITMTNTGILNLDAGPGISLANTGTSGITTITNTGVLSISINGLGLKASTSTGSVVLTNIGVTAATAGAGISVNQNTGSIIITNVGVQSIGTIGGGITVTTSTGSVFLLNSGVTSLTAGTDTNVTAISGDITIWDVSTLQSVTGRGNITTHDITIDSLTPTSNTASGALAVTGGVAVGQNLYAGGQIYALGGYLGLNPPAIFVNNTNVTVTDNANEHKVAVSINGTTTTTFDIVGEHILSTTNSTSTTTGALIVDGGIGLAKNIYVGGSATVANTLTVLSTSTMGSILPLPGGYYNLGSPTQRWGTLYINSATIDMGGLTLTSINSVLQLPATNVYGTATSTSTITGALTLQGGLGLTGDIFARNSINGGDVTSTGTIYRSGNITKSSIGTLGFALDIANATYTDAGSNGTVAQTAISHFHGSTISATGGTVSYTNAASVYISSAPVAGNGNTTLNNSWALQINSGKTKLNDSSVANSTQSGALQVVGGVGIGGDLYVQNTLNVIGTTANIGNSEIFTFTSPALSTSNKINLDTFAVASYQSAKYFIQVVDNTAIGLANKMYVTELIVYHDSIGGVYISEYGMASNFGDLGTFDAVISGLNVQLTWQPNYTPTSMVVKVHRTTLSR
jgi:hypothetical protein